MSKLLYALIVPILFFTSCCKDSDSDCKKKIIVTLVSTEDPITDVTLWTFGADNTLKQIYEFTSLQDASITITHLPVGEYQIVAVTNTNDAFTHNSVIGTTTLSELLLTINNPSLSVAHSHYGATTVTMEQGRVSKAQIALRRTMAEMQFTIKDIPSEVVSAQLYVLNSSIGYYPGASRLHSDVATVDLGHITPQSGLLQFDNKRLMPTVSMPTKAAGDVKTILKLILHYDNGGELPFHVETPALQNGGVYTPVITYSQLRPGITTEINTINGWVELPPINGEILNPN